MRDVRVHHAICCACLMLCGCGGQGGSLAQPVPERVATPHGPVHTSAPPSPTPSPKKPTPAPQPPPPSLRPATPTPHPPTPTPRRATPTPRPPTPGPETGDDKPCNGYRWAVKTATDAGANSIVVSNRIDTTIAAMRRLGAPAPNPSMRRDAPTETTVYRINNVTLQYIRKMPDGDYHLVVAGTNGLTMIVENPNPQCVPSSRFASQIRSVRSKIDNAFPHISATPIHIHTVVSVQGIGFYDRFSGTFGQAPNGIELHPLVAICFGMNCKL